MFGCVIQVDMSQVDLNCLWATSAAIFTFICALKMLANCTMLELCSTQVTVQS